MSDRVPSSTVRAQLARMLDRATFDNKVVRIHRSRGRPDAVLVKAERYDALVALEAECTALSSQHIPPQYFVPLHLDDLEAVPMGEPLPGARSLDLPRRKRPHVTLAPEDSPTPD